MARLQRWAEPQRARILFSACRVFAHTRPGRSLKTYEVWVRGRVTDEHVTQALAGVDTPVGVCRARAVEVLGGAGPRTRLRIVLDEGRNRHIRRLFGALHDPRFGTPLKVLELKRTAVGELTLDIPSGQWRVVTSDETALCLAGARATR